MTVETNEKEVNPWAVCHSSTGPKKSAKFERCVKDVKKKQGIKVAEGLIKRANKDKKNLKLLGVRPEEKGKAEWIPKPGTPESPRIQAHKAKRGVKKSKVVEITKNIVEGIVKKLNKAKKNAFLGNRKEYRKANSISKGGEGHAALNMAGVLRKLGDKEGAKRFMKAARESEEMEKSIQAAGGDPETYAAIKKSKTASLEKAVRNTGSRASVLGKSGGMYDKKGQKVKQKATKGTANFKKGPVSKPLPLKIKGKPGPGKKMQNVRGKSVHTSRSTGQEEAKARASSDAFNKLVTSLSKRKS